MSYFFIVHIVVSHSYQIRNTAILLSQNGQNASEESWGKVFVRVSMASTLL